MAFNLKEIIDSVVVDGASDLHLNPGLPPIFRIKKQLVTKENFNVLTVEDIDYFLSQILSNEQRKLFEINKELFLSVNFGNNIRFRITVFNTKGGYPAVALRTIPFKTPALESLNLPPIIKRASELKQGLVLITGPTGQGKTTTIAAILEKINNERNEHIVTIEDPIEFLFESKKSFIQQMEVAIDTISWSTSLRSVSRVDPNIIMVGEINDVESLTAALNLAETGHLVISSLHTNSASQTIDRIVSSFPESSQGQIKNQLSMVLEMVVSQRLVETIDGNLLPAVEVLIPNSAVKNMIRSGQIFAIDNVIATSANLGMTNLDTALAELVNSGKVSLNNALRYSLSPENLTRLVKKQ
jgi:twitching motility protein PilT